MPNPEIDPKNVYPIGSRLLVEIDEGDKFSSTGLELSNANNFQMPVMGKVLKSGSDNFKAGDILLFRRYAIDELELNVKGDKVKIYLVDEEDVIGQIKETL